MKILIVEDDNGCLLVLTMFMKSIGYNPDDFILTENGQESVELFEKNKDDISFVLMDVRLPKLDGYEATRQIMKIKKVPVIMITAQAMVGSRRESLEAGCVDHLCKPYKVDELKDMLIKHNLYFVK